MATERFAASAPANDGLILSSSRARAAMWLMTATLTGGVIMGLELLGFRLYAPYFGYSIYVWESLIAVVMAALAGGYALGGWISDRSHQDTPLYLIIFLSGIYQLIVIYSAGRRLWSLWNDGVFIGPIVATWIIFALPTLALAGISPFVIRFLARAGNVGSSAGEVYALSTTGSIVGVLAIAFLLIPDLGTHATLKILCATSVIIGMAGLVANCRFVLLGILVLVILAAAPKTKLHSYEIWRHPFL